MKNLFSGSMGACTALCLALAGSALSTPAWALNVAGVSYTAHKPGGAGTLVLNGAGVRKLANADLYAAALYLQEKLTTPGAVLADKGAKQLTVTMLRDVTGREMADLLSRGLVDNSSNDALAGLMPEIMGLGTLIAERGKLRSGDSFQIDWSATTGTTITVRQQGGKVTSVEVFPKPDLISAMMRIWLGERPADATLKSALLGQRM